jgi:hypothetical protein
MRSNPYRHIQKRLWTESLHYFYCLNFGCNDKMLHIMAYAYRQWDALLEPIVNNSNQKYGHSSTAWKDIGRWIFLSLIDRRITQGG